MSSISDILLYDTCPRRYEYFRHYGFEKKWSEAAAFGTLVHACMERVCRMLADGSDASAVGPVIEGLVAEEAGRVGAAQRTGFSDQSLRRVERQAKGFLQHVRSTGMMVLVSEEKVAYEGEDWRVEGRADLLAEVNGGLAVLDLKSGQRPAADAEIVDKYRKQLALYGLMVERNQDRQVENLSVYWMDEDLGSDAVMEVEDTGAAVLEARNLLGCTVEKIKARDFAVSRPPDKEVCQRCELHTVCKKEGIFICPQA